MHIIGDGDPSKVVCSGDCLDRVVCIGDITVFIDTKEARPGELEVHCIGPGGKVMKCELCDQNDGIHTASVNIQEASEYFLRVSYNKEHVPGSPFLLKVSDPSKVICSGEGLKRGTLGSEILSVIDTRWAGPASELTVECKGPSTVAQCKLYQCQNETFNLKVQPQEAGKHDLEIRYCGQHVPGSPFMLEVKVPLDASKVRVTGPGLRHGVLATFQSMFTVETTDVGMGELDVQVWGPAGAAHVDITEKPESRMIVCSYETLTPGKHVICIMWSGKDILGSPFNVSYLTQTLSFHVFYKTRNFQASKNQGIEPTDIIFASKTGLSVLG